MCAARTFLQPLFAPNCTFAGNLRHRTIGKRHRYLAEVSFASKTSAKMSRTSVRMLGGGKSPSSRSTIKRKQFWTWGRKTLEHRKNTRPGARGKKRIEARGDWKTYPSERCSCTYCGAGGVPLTNVAGVVLCVKCADKFGPDIRAEARYGT